jgi:hypothetical protein
MNELVKQLAVQAKIQMVSEPRLQEFAELVARECANICEDLSFTPEGPSLEARYQRGLCAGEIRKQFGVPAEFRKSA